MTLVFCLVFLADPIWSADTLSDTGLSSVKIESLNGRWSYSWGDLSYVELNEGAAGQESHQNSGSWDYSSGNWIKSEFPADLPDKQSNIVWLKLDVPEGRWRDPYIYVSSIDLTVQVYEKGNLIYQYGAIDSHGSSRFEGWPWHLVPIAQSSLGQSIYFRIFSDYTFIGLSGEALIGNESDLLSPVYKRGVVGLLFVTLVALAGLMSMSIGIIKRDSSVAVATGLLSLDLALMMFAENELSQTLYFDPLMWRYIAAFSYFMIPVFLSWVIWGWFKNNRPKVVLPVLLVSTAFVLVVLGLTLFTGFSFINAYPAFDIFFIITVMVLMAGCLNHFKGVGIQGIIVLFSIATLFLSLLVDMLSAHGFIDWVDHAGQWGLVIFAISSLSIYLIKDWRQQIVLSILTNTLELQVEERTKELQESKQTLEKLAREDFLTGLLNRRAFMERASKEVANAIRHNRPLSLVLFDIDFFKTINDEYGHATGDDVLKKLSDVTIKQCREGDLICRYGGEEFVILLHATPASDAENLVKRLQTVINSLVITADSDIHITASFGLVSLKQEQERAYNADKLLSRMLSTADEAMYNVKKSGRNGIESCFLS